jgi:hypothetical protein
MPTSRTRTRIRLILAFILLCFLAIVAYLDLAGMPQWLKNNMLRRLSKGDLAFEVDTVHCHVLRALDMKGLRVFTYGQIGQPVVEAERVFFKIDPLAKVRDESIVPSVFFENVIVRPTLIGGDSRKKARIQNWISSFICGTLRSEVCTSVSSVLATSALQRVLH